MRISMGILVICFYYLTAYSAASSADKPDEQLLSDSQRICAKKFITSTHYELIHQAQQGMRTAVRKKDQEAIKQLQLLLDQLLCMSVDITMIEHEDERQAMMVRNHILRSKLWQWYLERAPSIDSWAHVHEEICSVHKGLLETSLRKRLAVVPHEKANPAYKPYAIQVDRRMFLTVFLLNECLVSGQRKQVEEPELTVAPVPVTRGITRSPRVQDLSAFL